MEMPSSANDKVSFKTNTMVFTQFKSIGDVIRAYQLSIREEDFIKTTPIYIAPEVLHKEIQFSLRQRLHRHSDEAICEQLIHPILRSLWLHVGLVELLLWSHTSFEVTDEFSVTPNYVFSERSLVNPKHPIKPQLSLK
jgi:hypothetical protein